MNTFHPRTVPVASTIIAHPLLWLLLLAAAHVVVRVAISPSLKWDEAEQMLWSQHLALGYGSQPPLYTWLQWAVNAVLGPSVLSLSVLKHAALALTYVLMWGAAREVLGPRGAWWASASMLLLPPLGWYSVRDQTHSVLVTAMTCASWWLLIRLVKRPRPLEFGLLGLVFALGMLSKYSFAMVGGALILAALTVPEARRALLSRGWWWTPIVAALILLPHASWLATHLQEATTETLNKMQIQPDASVGKGLLSLLTVVLGVVLLWGLAALWSFRSAWWQRPVVPAAPWLTLIFNRYFALILLALLGMVLLGGVSNFRERWVLPLLCALPLMAFTARPELEQHPRAGRYTATVVAFALLLLAAAGGRLWFGLIRGDADELNHPVVELAARLQEAGYDGRSPIIAADHMLAGSLRTRFPAATTRACAAREGDDVPTCVASVADRAREAGQGWLLVSRADRLEPDWWSHAQSKVEPAAVLGVELPYIQLGKLAPAYYRFAWHPAKEQP